MGDGPLPKPHGFYNPAQAVTRLLKAAKFSQQVIRKNEGYGGFTSKWDSISKTTRLQHHAPDSLSAEEAAAEVQEMLPKYQAALEAKGYKVKKTRNALKVYPKEKAPTSATKSAKPEEPTKPKEPEAPEGTKPVHHVVTGKLVGFLGPDTFIPVD